MNNGNPETTDMRPILEAKPPSELVDHILDDAITLAQFNRTELALRAEVCRLRGLLQAAGDERDTYYQALQEIVEKGPPAEYEHIARKALQI